MSEENDNETCGKVKEAMAIIFANLNTMGRDKDVQHRVVSYLENEHRTLQQAFMRNVIAPVIVHFAKQGELGYYDLRNEATVNTCKELKKVLDKNLGFPFI